MYYAKVNWFNDYDNEDKVDYIFLFADDWNEAMAKINDQFEYINSIEMRQIDSINCGLLFVPSEYCEAIIAENQVN